MVQCILLLLLSMTYGGWNKIIGFVDISIICIKIPSALTMGETAAIVVVNSAMTIVAAVVVAAVAMVAVPLTLAPSLTEDVVLAAKCVQWESGWLLSLLLWWITTARPSSNITGPCASALHNCSKCTRTK